MNIEAGKITAAEAAVGSSIAVTLTLKYAEREEAPVAVTGQLQTTEGRRIAALRENQWIRNPNVLRAQSTSRNPEEVTRELSLIADLSKEHVEFLERLRDKDPQKSVRLSALVHLRFGKCHAHLEEGSGGRVLEANGRLLEFATIDTAVNFTILASQWVHDFAPRLGIGTFAVFEIPSPATVEADADGGTELGALINSAVESARAARAKLVAGEWQDVMDDLRGVAELFYKRSDLVTPLLVADGYDQAAADQFVAAMQAQFLLSSKFEHKLEQGKKAKIRPDIKPTKEEAYLAFSNSLASLNLVAAKYRRRQR
jgi:hypothetical protein